MNQKEAVYKAVTSTLTENGIHFEDGNNSKELLSKEMSQAITQILVTGFQARVIELKDTPSNQEKLADPKKLTLYCNELKVNWLKKDTRLNGGTKHEIQNPGSRVSDPGVRALKALYESMESNEVKAELQAEIDKRVEEIRASKAAKKAPKINVEHLPEEIRAKYASFVS